MSGVLLKHGQGVISSQPQWVACGRGRGLVGRCSLVGVRPQCVGGLRARMHRIEPAHRLVVQHQPNGYRRVIGVFGCLLNTFRLKGGELSLLTGSSFSTRPRCLVVEVRRWECGRPGRDFSQRTGSSSSTSPKEKTGAAAAVSSSAAASVGRTTVARTVTWIASLNQVGEVGSSGRFITSSV